ncbi:MAG: hypothetical protein H7Z14_20825 [Anaerolineae bacterium]|nr:hypothetical protein [Phycisphaerae bacterium]
MEDEKLLPFMAGKPLIDGIDVSYWNSVVGELHRIGNEHRLATIITHGFVDIMVNGIIEKTCRDQKQIVADHRQWGHAAKLVLIHEMKVLTDRHYRLLKWFNSLRNDFAHKPQFVLTEDRMSILEKPEHRALKNFHMLCIQILMDLWVNYFGMIGEMFVKGLGPISPELLTRRQPTESIIVPLSDP